MSSVEFKVGQPEQAITRRAIRVVNDNQDAKLWFAAGFTPGVDTIAFTDAEVTAFQRAHPEVPINGQTMAYVAKSIGSDGKGITIFVEPID